MRRRRLTYLDWDDLSSVRERINRGDQKLIGNLDLLLTEADELLALPALSVVQKAGLADSGDPHDFYAIGAYSWPNPDTPSSKPYIYKDSDPNPAARDSDEFDKGHYEEMVRRVSVLSLGWYLSRNEVYAERAINQLRVWFIDPKTRMNPNFRYAAGRPGVYDGHFSGIIEGVILIELLDYVALLESSPLWSSNDAIRLLAWFEQLVDWLISSRFGRLESLSKNNHGSWYLAQVLAFSTFTGDKKRARQVLPIARRQIRRQIMVDGSMPLELERADGLFYSVYALRAFVVIARIAEEYGENLWTFPGSAASESLIQQALASLGPYLTGAACWSGTKMATPYLRYALQIYRMEVHFLRDPKTFETLDALRLRKGDVGEWGALLDCSHKALRPAPSGAVPVQWDFTGVRRTRLRRAGELVLRRGMKALALVGLWPGARIR